MKDQLFSGGVWEFVVWGNTVYDYVLAAGIFFVFILVFKLIQRLMLRYLERVAERTKTEWDDAVITIVKTVKPPFYWFVSFYIALRYLNIEGVAEKVVSFVLVAWLVYQVVVAMRILIDFFVAQRMAKTDKGSQAATQLIHSLAMISLWVLAALFLLQNFGVNVTSLIAGLGIGGIAVALAAQNVLADLFSSLAIYFDKPFVPGDFIQFGQEKGTVQKIGIKTTRIKAIDGEEIIVPNTKLTGSLVRNMNRRKERRVLFTFGVTYSTSSAKLKKIPKIVKVAVRDRNKTKFERAHFTEFGIFALQFEAIYFIATANYKEYRNIHQKVLLAVKEAFEEEGIEMAYPTQTIYLQRDQGIQ